MMLLKIFFSLLLLFPSDVSSQENTAKKSPYKVSWENESLTFSTGLLVAFTISAADDSIPILSVAEINVLNKNDINSIDRISVGVFSKTQDKLSDVLVGGSILSPLLFVFDEDIRNDAGTISTMYLQTVMFATFLPSLSKGTVKRIRPYVYSSKASLADKQVVDARHSFFSRHATFAFATSIFFANVYTDFHPDSEYKNYIWSGAIGLASAVSILRVTSGQHFISDVIVGAAVGSSIGYLIPYIHRNNTEDFSLHTQISPNYSGLTFSFRLK